MVATPDDKLYLAFSGVNKVAIAEAKHSDLDDDAISEEVYFSNWRRGYPLSESYIVSDVCSWSAY